MKSKLLVIIIIVIAIAVMIAGITAIVILLRNPLR